uniref:Putative replicase n=1 Tax=Rutsystermes virus TaxID=2796631 RepID=A0A7T7GV64_9VIRU|nr:putative replicase [Rutsystermes virus]
MERIPAELASVIADNVGLTAFLALLEKGRSATPRSWLYEKEPPNSVLNRWLESLQTLEQSSDPFVKKVLTFDREKLKVWGPQGAVPPLTTSIKKVDEYYSSPKASPAFSDPDWLQAIHDTRLDLFGPRCKLRPASYLKVVDDMRMRDTLSTNSGFPDFQRRSDPAVKSRAIADAASGKWIDYPAILLFRQYFGKLRQVWMFPMATNLVEGSFTQPIMAAMRARAAQNRIARDGLAPWTGFTDVKRVVSEWYADPNSYIFGGDFTGMDIHMRESQMEQVFCLLAPLFTAESRTLLHASLMNANRIGLLLSRTHWMPQGTNAHGLASGSNWTQLPETLFQFILNRYMAAKMNTWFAMCAIGDDSATNTPISNYPMAPKLIPVYESVGMEANISKQSDSPEELTFLQRLFQRGYTKTGQVRAVYPTIRALETSVFPERWHKENWNSNMFAVRQYMILENCVDHPLFEEFVKFIVRGQKDLIPFAKLSAKALVKYQAEANLIPNLNSTYNQEKRDAGLADFESIKIAQAM